jgi:hypothetical protein
MQPASAQKRYPSIEDDWDATDYRAVVQRVENDGLELPTLANSDTKPVFERMVHPDNIPLRMGQNKKLAITIRFQRLEPLLQPVHQLVVFYSNETKKGKPYATELSRMMIYESKATATLLELCEPYLATLIQDKRYQARVAEFDQMKNGARQVYAALVQSATETGVYSKSDILKMIGAAVAGLPSYQPIFRPQDKQQLTQALAQQISKTPDADVKKALTDLREAIEQGRTPA